MTAGVTAKAATAASAERLLQEVNSVLRHAYMACCELREPLAIRGLGAWAASAFSPLKALVPGTRADEPTLDMLPGMLLSKFRCFNIELGPRASNGRVHELLAEPDA